MRPFPFGFPCFGGDTTVQELESDSLYEPIARIRQGRRLDIATAFLRLMHEKEMGRITVKEIAEEAHINRKTFYRNFENIQSLASYIYEGMGRVYATNYVDSLVMTGGIDHFFEFKRTSIERYLDYYRALALSRAKNVLYERVFTCWIADALDQLGDMGVELDAKARLCLQMSVYNIMAMFSEWETNDRLQDQMSVEELIDLLKWASKDQIATVLDSISSAKGETVKL